jgi:hypothetical protein
MSTTAGEYLVHHGAAGHLGRFRAAGGDVCARGDAVVVRTARGLELGEVLAPADGSRVTFPDAFVGELLRRATRDDLAAVARGREVGIALCADGERLAFERALPLAVVDVEMFLDGRQAVLHVLKLGPCDEGPWLADLGDRHGLIVRLYDLAREPAEPADAREDGHGCETCGSGGCGDGECGSGGGGCTSCSSGAAADLAQYFAGLREQMERRQRLPLL